jgi:hypothetical protein
MDEPIRLSGRMASILIVLGTMTLAVAVAADSLTQARPAPQIE